MVAVLSAHLLGALREHVGLYAVQEQFHGNVGPGTVLTLGTRVGGLLQYFETILPSVGRATSFTFIIERS